MRESKSYLDLFLDNAYKPKKREKYFTQETEDAIIEYNSEFTTQAKKNYLFETIIMPAFNKTISGVLEMPQFRWIAFNKKINREELIDATFERLVRKVHLFTPNLIGRNGVRVKAFSYFTVIARHFITEYTEKVKKIIKNKADVESSIDLSILSEDVLERMSSGIKHEDCEIEDYIGVFKASRDRVLKIIINMVMDEEESEKPDKDFIRIGYLLKFLLTNSDLLEYKKKNEFMRLLTLYSGFSQQKVSIIFKRFKQEVLKEMNPSLFNKLSKKKAIKEDEDDDREIELSEKEFQESFEDLEENTEINEDEERLNNLSINSFEDFEFQQIKLENLKWKQQQKLSETNQS